MKFESLLPAQDNTENIMAIHRNTTQQLHIH